MARGDSVRGERHVDLTGLDQRDPAKKVRHAGREPDYPLDLRGVAYPSRFAPRDSYLTTNDLGKELRLSSQQVHRWCVKWFGPLPEGRAVKGGGYRIPLQYRYVARFWKAVEDPHDRIQGMKALLEEVRPWVVVVGPYHSTHWTHGEVVTRLDAVLSSRYGKEARVTVKYVGPLIEE